jgi:hypothetical protein
MKEERKEARSGGGRMDEYEWDAASRAEFKRPPAVHAAVNLLKNTEKSARRREGESYDDFLQKKRFLDA